MWFSVVCTLIHNEYASSQRSKCCVLTRRSRVSPQQILTGRTRRIKDVSWCMSIEDVFDHHCYDLSHIHLFKVLLFKFRRQLCKGMWRFEVAIFSFTAQPRHFWKVEKALGTRLVHSRVKGDLEPYVYVTSVRLKRSFLMVCVSWKV